VIRSALVIALALALTGCATGRELNGSWLLVIARDGTCRQIVHEAKTDQLDTKTTWRGEGCKPAAPEPIEP
jgi:hypothetical protein